MRLGALLALVGALGTAISAPSPSPVPWRVLAAGSSPALPGARLTGASFAGTTADTPGPVGWRVAVLSSRTDVAHARPAVSPPVRAAIARAGASTSFAYRRLVLIVLATPGGCCPIGVASIATGAGAAQIVLRHPDCSGSCPTGGASFVVLSVRRSSFAPPKRLTVRVEPPAAPAPAPSPTASCPNGYSYAGFVSSPAASLTATLTMSRVPGLVTANDHALAYASIVARDAQQVPRAWLQAGIGRGAIGTYSDDGRAWVYVEAQTAAGYQLNEIAPATAGVPVGLTFSGGGSTWTVAVDGKPVLSVDLGTPATGTSTAVEVYRATAGGACPSLDFTLGGVVPKGDRRGLLPLVDESAGGWRVVLG